MSCAKHQHKRRITSYTDTKDKHRNQLGRKILDSIHRMRIPWRLAEDDKKKQTKMTMEAASGRIKFHMNLKM